MDIDFSFEIPEIKKLSGIIKEYEQDKTDYAAQLLNNNGFIPRAIVMGIMVFTFSFNNPSLSPIVDTSLEFSVSAVSNEDVIKDIEDEILSHKEHVCEFWKHEAVKLALLREGWDGGNAKRVSTTAISNVLNLLDRDELRLDYIQDIYANDQGTVSIEWKNDRNELAGIQVGRKYMSYYLTLQSDKVFKDYEPINAKGLNELFYNLSLL